MNNASLKNAYARKHIRFKGEPDHIAEIDWDGSREGFRFEQAALIIDEAPMGGCCLLFVGNFGSRSVGDTCRIKLGPLAPLKAKLVWRRTLDDGIFRVGFEFLE